MGQKHVLCIQTVLCASVGTESHQHGLGACNVYGDHTVCSCRHSKSSAWVRSMYCVCRPYCVQLKAQQVISMGQKHVLCIQTVLCAALPSWQEFKKFGRCRNRTYARATTHEEPFPLPRRCGTNNLINVIGDYLKQRN